LIEDANQLVFVNFYVNWCRFSQNLNPIYEDLAEKITKQYSKKKNEGLIQIGKVNCEISGNSKENFFNLK